MHSQQHAAPLFLHTISLLLLLFLLSVWNYFYLVNPPRTRAVVWCRATGSSSRGHNCAFFFRCCGVKMFSSFFRFITCMWGATSFSFSLRYIRTAGKKERKSWVLHFRRYCTSYSRRAHWLLERVMELNPSTWPHQGYWSTTPLPTRVTVWIIRKEKKRETGSKMWKQHCRDTVCLNIYSMSMNAGIWWCNHRRRLFKLKKPPCLLFLLVIFLLGIETPPIFFLCISLF